MYPPALDQTGECIGGLLLRFFDLGDVRHGDELLTALFAGGRACLFH